MQIEAGHLARGDQRDADAAEGDRRSVRDQAESGRVARIEAKANQHARRDRHRGAEAGTALEERAEAERDEQRLYAPIFGQ